MALSIPESGKGGLELDVIDGAVDSFVLPVKDGCTGETLSVALPTTKPLALGILKEADGKQHARLSFNGTVAGAKVGVLVDVTGGKLSGQFGVTHPKAAAAGARSAGPGPAPSSPSLAHRSRHPTGDAYGTSECTSRLAGGAQGRWR